MPTQTPGQKWREERAELIHEAEQIINRCRDEQRGFTDEERKSVEDKHVKIKAIDDRVKSAERTSAIMNEISGVVSNDGPAFDHEQKSALIGSLKSRSSYSTEIGRKAFGTVPLTLPAEGEGVVGALPPATALRDLFPVENTTSATIRYYVVSQMTGADLVAEGAEKPNLTGNYVPKTVDVEKIAATFGVTTELMDDAPFVLQELQRQALAALLRRENQLVLDTMNSTSGIITATGTNAEALDVIATQIGAHQAITGASPDAIVMHPADLSNLRKFRTSGSGEYILDPTTAGPSGIFGVQVYPTPVATPGQLWLIRRDAGRIYQRSGVKVTSGLAGNDLIENKATIVVEERMVPVIVQPNLLTRITLTAS